MPTTSINDPSTHPHGAFFLTEEPKTITDKHLPIFFPANTRIRMSLTNLKGILVFSAAVAFLACKLQQMGGSLETRKH